MEKANLWKRMRALAAGEIPATTLEAYRRASFTVYELLDRIECVRMDAKLAGVSAWDLRESTQAEILCAWNAFVFQSIGSEFLDADYRDKPETAGFVPPLTADQVMAFFGPVEGWLGRARQAGADVHYRLDVSVPAPFPRWASPGNSPKSHLHGMLAAMRQIREHARAAVDFLGTDPPEDVGHAKQYFSIKGMFAAAEAKAQYADDLQSATTTREVNARVEPSVKAAIEAFHLVGQLVAMPHLTDKPLVPKLPNSALPPNDSIPFDPWCLTDEDVKKKLQWDPEASRAILELWRRDPNPDLTRKINAELMAAYNRGDIVRAMGSNGKPLGHFFCCPWGTVYEVRKHIHLGGKVVAPYQQFVFDVTAEGMDLGHPFRRQIKVGNYRPTDEFEYGDPAEAPDH